MHKRPISSLSLPPATLGALTRAGFENVGDLAGFESAEALSTQLRIPIAQSQLVMSASQTIAPPTAASQSLASLSKAGVAQPRTTTCKELDNLLDGGLRQGRVYELSGPPGVPKDALALKTAASYARTGEGTLFVDCQNVINTDFLEDLHGDEQELISTTAVHTLAELVLTVLTLPTLLNRLPRTTLVVFGCFSAPFQSSSPAARTVALDRIKNALSKICATNRITVVTTCQCATKLLNSDGSPSNFDSGAQAVMRPAPGPNYMPPGRSSRVILVPNSPSTGHFRLLEPSAADTRRKNKPLEAPYSVKEIMQR
ncbi:hypothetical protein K523DRAFT_314787 [Schizophyllum commune Tattone D]|nr:hypothetical protein K523DRAFT_314787 [Schizophyllum commune Tattone D]